MPKPFVPGAGRQQGWSVSGPDVDRDRIPGRGPAVSYAQGVAARHMKTTEPRTYYVRDPAGAVRVTVEAAAGAVTTTRRES